MERTGRNAITAVFTAAMAFAPAIVLAQMTPPGGNSPTQPNQTPLQQQGANGPGNGNGPGLEGQNMRDRMFLRKAAEGGMAEIKLGELAAQKGGSQDVKDFGQKMVTDHTTLNDEMMPICKEMGVTAPKKLSHKDQAEYDKLNGLSGDDFDKEYMAYMVKDHHNDLRDFRQEMDSTQDPALKEAVTKAEHVIDQHATMADQIAMQHGINVPKKDIKSAEK